MSWGRTHRQRKGREANKRIQQFLCIILSGEGSIMGLWGRQESKFPLSVLSEKTKKNLFRHNEASLLNRKARDKESKDYFSVYQKVRVRVSHPNKYPLLIVC